MKENSSDITDMQSLGILKYSLMEPWFLRHDSSPWIGHSPFGRMLVAELKPGILVELGTHWGNSYFTFCQAVCEFSLSTKCFSVDSWEGDPQAGFYNDEIYDYVSKINRNNFSSFSTLMRMTFNEAVDDFEDESIDLLHIDGFHSHKAVSEDFYTWLPKVKKGGFILLHDTNEYQEGFGVNRFWNEIKLNADGAHLFRHSHGLGVWRKPGGDALSSEIISSLLRPNSVIAERIDAFCTALGQGQQQKSMLILKEQSLSVMQAELLGLQTQISNLINQNNILQAVADEHAKLSVEFKKVLSEYNKLLSEYNKLLSSRSWRVTMPLRAVGRFVREKFVNKE